MGKCEDRKKDPSFFPQLRNRTVREKEITKWDQTCRQFTKQTELRSERSNIFLLTRKIRGTG